MKCNRCIHYNVCLGYRNIDIDGDSNSCPYPEERQHEWIPCGERVPDLYEVVLVTDECGNVFEYERRPLDDEGNVCRKWSFLGRNIIAWMPMPEAYKAESEDKE